MPPYEKNSFLAIFVLGRWRRKSVTSLVPSVFKIIRRPPRTFHFFASKNV